VDRVLLKYDANCQSISPQAVVNGDVSGEDSGDDEGGTRHNLSRTQRTVTVSWSGDKTIDGDDKSFVVRFRLCLMANQSQMLKVYG
jgi:hypothetical protein